MGCTSWPACQEPLCFCLLITRCYWGVWAGQCAKSLCIKHTKRNELAAGSSRLQRCVLVLPGARPEPPTAISTVKSDAAAASWTRACCLTFLLAWSLPMHPVVQAFSLLTWRWVGITFPYIALCYIILTTFLVYTILYKLRYDTLHHVMCCPEVTFPIWKSPYCHHVLLSAGVQPACKTAEELDAAHTPPFLSSHPVQQISLSSWNWKWES